MCLNKLILVLLCLFSLAACSPVSLAHSYCSARLAQAADVTVAIKVGSPVLHNDKSRGQIGLDLNQSGKAVTDGQAMGATTAAYEQQTNVSAGKTFFGPGFVCAQPVVELVLAVRAPVVDIAQEFEPGTCRYQTVLEHELQHVAAYSAHLAASQQALTEKVKERYRKHGYFFDSTAQGLDRQFTAETKDWLVPLVSAQLALSLAAQQAIDSPAEYLRLTLACPREPL